MRERKAYKALIEKRYTEALPALEAAVDSGSAWAHEWLGFLYLHGYGVAKSPLQAKQHFEAAYEGGRHAVARSAGLASFRAGFPDDALKWLRQDTDTPISSLYWQYRVLESDPLLQRHAGEGDELLQKAADAGHVCAQRAHAIRMIGGQKSFGTQVQGLLAFVRVFLQAWRIAAHDPHDQRLR